ncbi:MAG: hypothetical protein WC861_04440 [Candidatus Micrarchaeia archaeon]|jgi:hypothetical protein
MESVAEVKRAGMKTSSLFGRVHGLGSFYFRLMGEKAIQAQFQDRQFQLSESKLEKYAEKARNTAILLAQQVKKAVAGNMHLMAEYDDGMSLDFKVNIVGKGVGKGKDGSSIWCGVCGPDFFQKFRMWGYYEAFKNGNLDADFSIAKLSHRKKMTVGSITVDLGFGLATVVFPNGTKKKYRFEDISEARNDFCRAVKAFVPETAKAKA